MFRNIVIKKHFDFLSRVRPVMNLDNFDNLGKRYLGFLIELFVVNFHPLTYVIDLFKVRKQSQT